MSLHNNKSWFFSIVASVALFAGGSFMVSGENYTDAEMISFSELSDAEIDMIMAVKAEMQTAQIRAR